MGHFELTKGLLPALQEAYNQTGRKSWVVNVSSLAHVFSDVDLSDVNFKSRAYAPWTANVLFSVALTELYAEQGVSPTLFIRDIPLPGIIPRKGMWKKMSDCANGGAVFWSSSPWLLLARKKKTGFSMWQVCFESK